MVPSLVLGTLLLAPAAPVPADTIPTPTGPAPQVVCLKADSNGEVKVHGYTVQKQKYTQSMVTVVNGKQEVKQVEREQTVPLHFNRQLTEVGGKITTAGGTELTPAAAAQRVAGGAVVLVSADGKPVEKGWLRAVHPETVVIAAESLAGAVLVPPSPNLPTTPAPRLVLLAADADGRVNVAFNAGGAGVPGQYEEQFVGRGGVVVVNGQVLQRGGYNPGQGAAFGGEYPARPLDDVKFEAYELDGRAVPRADALRRLKAGGLVVIAGDARLPDAEYLKPFRGDLLVLVSSELALPPGANVKPAVRAPAVAPAGRVPAPVQIQPAGLPANGLKLAPVQRAVPAPAPAPAPKLVEEKKPLPEKQG
jgi:hypothetical protein